MKNYNREHWNRNFIKMSSITGSSTASVKFILVATLKFKGLM